MKYRKERWSCACIQGRSARDRCIWTTGTPSDTGRASFCGKVSRCESAASGLRLNIAAHEGRFQPWWQQMKVTVYGMARSPAQVSVGNKRVDNVRFDGRTSAIEFLVNDPASGSEVRIVY